MSYRFFLIDQSSVVRQAYPLDFLKSKLVRKNEPEQGQIFFRTKLSGKLTFINDPSKGINDFDYLLSKEQSNPCERILLRIEMLCEGEWTELWVGQFTTRKGAFDLDRCTFTIQPDVYDKYSCILSELDRKVNILDNPEVVTTTTFVIADYEYYICRCQYTGTPADDFCLSGCKANAPAPSGTWKIFQRRVRNANGEIVDIYFRERVVTSCLAGALQPPPSGSGWILLEDDCTMSQTAVWVRIPQATMTLNTQMVQPGLCTGSFGTIEEIPPPQVRLDVSLANKNNFTPEIWGWTNCLSGTYKYKVLNAPAYSSINWTTDSQSGGGAFNIIAGAGTDEITAVTSPMANTNIRATVEYSDLSLSVGGTLAIGNGTSPPSPFIKLLGGKYLCTGQTKCRYEAPEIPTLSGSSILISTFWIVPPGAVVTSGGGSSDNYVEFDLPAGLEGTERVQCNLRLTADGRTLFNYALIDVVINKAPYTGNTATPDNPHTGIVGADYAEAGTICKYSVYERYGSTYNWEAVGGTVVSGQGTSQVSVEWGLGTDGILYVKETISSSCCAWIKIIPCGDNGEPPYFWCGAGEQILYSRNRWLLGTVEYMAQNINCPVDYSLVSDFFEWNPVADTTGYSSGINYFTGMANQVNYLTIAAKSDVRLPNATNPATRADWSLKEAFAILREMFQAWWFIDDSGRLRIEHISWFSFPAAINLTIYSQYTKALNKYTHEETNIPKFERFRFMEALNTDFVGVDIWYDSLCANQKEDEQVLEHLAQDITTDIDYIFTNPNDISNRGFVIMANFFNGAGYEVITDTGELSGATLPNAPLAWANLHKSFYPVWRFLPEGYMNNILTAFGIRPNIKGQPIEVPMCCEFITLNPNNRVISELGIRLNTIGHITQAEFSLLKKTTTFAISYPYT